MPDGSSDNTFSNLDQALANAAAALTARPDVVARLQHQQGGGPAVAGRGGGFAGRPGQQPPHRQPSYSNIAATGPGAGRDAAAAHHDAYIARPPTFVAGSSSSRWDSNSNAPPQQHPPPSHPHHPHPHSHQPPQQPPSHHQQHHHPAATSFHQPQFSPQLQQQQQAHHGRPSPNLASSSHSNNATDFFSVPPHPTQSQVSLHDESRHFWDWTTSSNPQDPGLDAHEHHEFLSYEPQGELLDEPSTRLVHHSDFSLPNPASGALPARVSSTDVSFATAAYSGGESPSFPSGFAPPTSVASPRPSLASQRVPSNLRFAGGTVSAPLLSPSSGTLKRSADSTSALPTLRTFRDSQATSSTVPVEKRPRAVPGSSAATTSYAHAARGSAGSARSSISKRMTSPAESAGSRAPSETRGASAPTSPHVGESSGQAASGAAAASSSSAQAKGKGKAPATAPDAPALPAGKVFPIQIGSELFRLSGASISSDAPSYFSEFFGAQLRAAEGQPRAVQTLYIDRDPVTFKDIAMHLQGYHVQPRDGAHFVKLFADAQFYSLPRLTAQLFASPIFIQIGSKHFSIPRDIFSAPGNIPNYFSLGFAVFFSTPGEVFPGLDRQNLLRPPAILPPAILNRSGDIFEEILQLLQGYPVHIRDADHRAALLRDARYFHLKGLEQKLIPHNIRYSLLRKESEITIRLEDVRQSGISFLPDRSSEASSAPAQSTSQSINDTYIPHPGTITYSRPFADNQPHTLILEISSAESTVLSFPPAHVLRHYQLHPGSALARFEGTTYARVAALFAVIASKIKGTASSEALAFTMIEQQRRASESEGKPEGQESGQITSAAPTTQAGASSSGSAADISASGTSTNPTPTSGALEKSGLSGERVKVIIDREADVWLDQQRWDYRSLPAFRSSSGPTTGGSAEGEADDGDPMQVVEPPVALEETFSLAEPAATTTTTTSTFLSPRPARKRRRTALTEAIVSRSATSSLPGSSSGSNASDSDDNNDGDGDQGVVAARRRAQRRARPSQKRKSRDDGDSSAAQKWIVKRALWRLRVEPSTTVNGQRKVDLTLHAVKIEAYTSERARNQDRIFLDQMA